MRKSKASEAHRVAQHVAAIRAALHKHGYQIRKRPKQAAWTITPLNPSKTMSSLARGTGRKLNPSSATATETKRTPSTTETEAKQAPPLVTGALVRRVGGVKQETAGTQTSKSYFLTYQPAPISAWILHPQTNDPDRHALETLIQRAIARSAS